MKHKIFLIVSGILLGVLLVFVALFGIGKEKNDAPIEIKNGFSPELLNAMKERYQITIPDDAVFIRGFNTNSFRDPCVVFLFELPMETELSPDDCDGVSDYVFQRLNIDESHYDSAGRGKQHYLNNENEDLTRIYDYDIKRKHEGFTFLSFSVETDRIIFRFVGWHPSGVFD